MPIPDGASYSPLYDAYPEEHLTIAHLVAMVNREDGSAIWIIKPGQDFSEAVSIPMTRWREFVELFLSTVMAVKVMENTNDTDHLPRSGD